MDSSSPAVVFCPAIDDEMRHQIDGLKLAGMVKDSFDGKDSPDLSKVDTSTKLYILGHGNTALPVLSTGGEKFTTKQLAMMLTKAGLSKKHRNIEMLVCHGGESVTTRKAAEVLWPLFEKYQQLKSAETPDDGAIKKVIENFQNALKKHNPPAKDFDKTMVLPYCAKFMDEMKTLKYDYMMIRAYKAPVCMYFDSKGVRLDLTEKEVDGRAGSWGSLASDHPSFVVDWH